MDVTVNVLFCDVGFGGLGFSASPPVHALGPGPSEGDPTNEAEARETQLLSREENTENFRMSSKKGPFQKERSVFQPLSFREYVSFWERKLFFSWLA